jgi:hypothetical protein
MYGAGVVKDYAYVLEALDEDSRHGIGGGRIISLDISKNKRYLYRYDKGLCFDELDSGGMEIYADLIKQYN